MYFYYNFISIPSNFRLGFIKERQKMNSLIISLIMGAIFLFIFISQLFSLQKEVRKLKSITSHLLKEIKILKDNNDK